MFTVLAGRRTRLPNAYKNRGMCVHNPKSDRGPSILNYILCLLASIIITPVSSFVYICVPITINEKETMNLKRGVDLRSWRKRKEKMM